MVYDVIIIGSGPAGFSASIYTSRAHLKTLQFEGEQPGGQLTTTTEVENYAGFKDGIQGPQLMNDMREQTKRFGTETKFEMVTSVDLQSRPFKVTTGSGEYEANALIISTGARARYLGLENEKRLIGHGVSACATCDGFFFKDREVVVVGGGDSAMEEANHLTKFATKVTLLNRTEEFRASPIMLDRAKNNPKITLMTSSSVSDV
ncbi:MAG: FAD-dependent oxidoreductase, partial [Nanoarchaeota archaeon]|nr:FAD-dependent oxidoreductase [Nanoarchaeota archaeon]